MTDLFKEKAKDWDASDRRTQLSRGIGSSILEHVPLASDWHVMDFGAGTGLLTSQIAPRVAKITAVDVSASMLEKLSEKSQLQDKLEVVCQDITQTPLSTRFDLIISAMAMHHVQDTEQLVIQFAHHLKPNGRVALSDLDSEDGSFHTSGTEGVFHHGFDRGQLKSLFEKHGFTYVQFFTAYEIKGETQTYPIFLLSACYSGEGNH